MKKLWILACLALMMACNTKNSNPSTENSTPLPDENGNITYQYKIEGLQDSVIYDSIWKMIFHVKGVNTLVLNKVDLSASFTIDPDSVSQEKIMSEIALRGGKIVKP